MYAWFYTWGAGGGMTILPHNIYFNNNRSCLCTLHTSHYATKEVIKCLEFVKPVNSSIYPSEKNKALK